MVNMKVCHIRNTNTHTSRNKSVKMHLGQPWANYSFFLIFLLNSCINYKEKRIISPVLLSRPRGVWLVLSLSLYHTQSLYIDPPRGATRQIYTALEHTHQHKHTFLKATSCFAGRSASARTRAGSGAKYLWTCLCVCVCAHTCPGLAPNTFGHVYVFVYARTRVRRPGTVYDYFAYLC